MKGHEMKKEVYIRAYVPWPANKGGTVERITCGTVRLA